MRELFGNRACRILVSSLLSGIARPALAYGSSETAAANAGGWYLIMALLLIVVIGVPVLLLRVIGGAIDRARQRRETRACNPEVPVARVVRDHDQAR